jgi:Tfp pilus assembly PilM family ATPase
MRSSSAFFKLFPPPKFLLMPHAGLEISDEGFRFVSYAGVGDARRVQSYGREDLPPGIFSEGDIRDEAAFVSRLSAFAEAHRLFRVKVSIPEEKAYLFQTDVPSREQRSIEQNIEFKLEENVPLAAKDAVFYFDLLPRSASGDATRASVSVVPRSYIERYIRLLESAGLEPVSFEIAPKAIVRALVHPASETTRFIIHFMKGKTGIHIASGTAVRFTFTAPWGEGAPGSLFPREELAKEIARIRAYWVSHGDGKAITQALLVGDRADALAEELSGVGGDAPLSLVAANVWENALRIERSLPPMPMSESFGYAVAAGLAFDAPSA